MGRKTRVKKPNLLYQRLLESLNRGCQVQIETHDNTYYGIPIYLDREFVEILEMSPSDETYEEFEFDSDEENVADRLSWLIRLSAISAIAYPAEHWLRDRLERLLAQDDAIAPQKPQKDD
ncbi:MAG: hypothetical protein HC925_03275 [Coleofasciculaceae cyanobacterium SM2_3_26]|nr:hypothetical protein [Coleofasciculaceae cyanobacterium SM2_3_26]